MDNVNEQVPIAKNYNYIATILLLSSATSDHHTIGVGTTTYAAPEQLKSSLYTNKVIINKIYNLHSCHTRMSAVDRCVCITYSTTIFRYKTSVSHGVHSSIFCLVIVQKF